jgi:hypothetical protein
MYHNNHPENAGTSRIISRKYRGKSKIPLVTVGIYMLPYNSAPLVLNFKNYNIHFDYASNKRRIRFREDMKQGIQRNGFHSATIPVKGC